MTQASTCAACVVPKTSLHVPRTMTTASTCTAHVVAKPSSLQVPETSALTPASTSTTCVVPKTTSPQVLASSSTSSLLPGVPESGVPERQSSGLPVVPLSDDACTITQYNLIQVQQQFGDVTVKGGENLNIGGTQNVGTTPAKQEEEEKPLTAAQKIRKRTASRIESWTKDMVETKALKKVKEKLNRGATWVTIKGRPGEGKSTTAYMALKDQYSQGRQVYQVVSPEEFNEVIMACSNPVIMLDDIFGDLEFDTGEWTKWRPSLRPIVDVKHPDKYSERDLERTNVHQTQQKQASSNNDETIIILVGRDYVLKSSLADLGRMADYISSPQYVVEVSSQRDSYERRKIWRVHAEAKNIDLEESLVSQICEANCPHGFPHVCKMFATVYEKDWTQGQMQTFFQAPLDFLRMTLDKCLQDERKRSLFMAMIKRDGKTTLLELEEDDSLGYECTETADHLVGSYLKKEDDTYMFDHPSIYDSVSFILSTKLSKFVIQNCSLLFINQRLRIAPSRERKKEIAEETNLVANISWTYAGHLARRFVSELEMGNLLHVLSHQAFCNSNFVDMLMDCLKTHCCMSVSDIVKLTDNSSIQSFCELLSSNKSHHLIKYIMEKENISFSQIERRDILLGVCMNAACSVLKYISGRMKLEVNARYGRMNKTPLMLAAETRDSVFVNQVMSLGPDLNARDDLDVSAFRYLCQNGLTSAVEHMIDKGIDVNEYHGPYKHPIYLAIEEGHLEMVKVLINRGCDIDNQKGFTSSLWSRNETMVQFFLNRGVDVDAFAVCRACEVGELNVVKMLFEKGASVKIKTADGSTPLLSSCKGNPNVVSYLVKKGASVNQTSNVAGSTPLHIATRQGSTDVVDVLLKAGAAVNVQNNIGDTPLHEAARCGSSDVVDVLLKAGAAVIAQNNVGDTPLHGAAERGSVDHVDMLLKAGADVNVQNNGSDTPLHTAACSGSTDVVDVLLKAGADVNVQNNIGDTPLHKTGACRPKNMVDVLLKAGANGNVRNNRGETPLSKPQGWIDIGRVERLLRAGVDVNVQDNAGDTPLHGAANWRSIEYVDVLLKAGADVNVGNNRGDTPLHRAAGQGSTELVDVLLKAGAHVNVQNNTGVTALHIATGRRSVEMADVLLKAKAYVNVQNNGGDTVLHTAARQKSAELMEEMLKAGAHVYAQNNAGDTPLHTLAEGWSKECAVVLLEAGAGVNVQNNTGDTPLHKALLWASSELWVNVLLRAGANVNLQNNTGNTPLQIAADKWWVPIEMIKVLLRSGADVNVQNEAGDTPLHKAIGRGSTELVDVLVKAGANVNEQNNTGDTALHKAAEWGSSGCVGVLLKAGADVNVQNNTGDTPRLHLTGWRSTKCVDTSLNGEGAVNVQNNTTDHSTEQSCSCFRGMCSVC